MVQLSQEAKEAIVLQALNRGSKSIKAIASLNNVGLSTLQNWMKIHREGGALARPHKGTSSSSGLSQAERFEHLVATHHMDEMSLGEYCRKQGLYSHELNQWREEYMNVKADKQTAKETAELRKLKAENKRLSQELRRKEKALAEASALLILKKKADLIWGVAEGD